MKLEFQLSKASVQKTKEAILQYQKTYRKTMEDIMKQVAKDSEKYARKKLIEYGAFYSGHTYNSIYILISSYNRFKLHFGGASSYIEYGTGIVGKQNPHPKASELGITYDVNSHGYDGWYYYDDVSHKIKKTLGMPSRPFINDTRKYMKNRFNYLVKKHLGGK